MLVAEGHPVEKCRHNCLFLRNGDRAKCPCSSYWDDFSSCNGDELMMVSALRQGKGFASILFSLIERRGLTDVEAYRKAHVSRQLFSRIRSNPNYHPSKRTVLKFAIALELTIGEAKLLLLSAGFIFIYGDITDEIIKHHILSGCYDFYVINESLFRFGLRPFDL